MDIPVEESLIKYPCDFPIKVMGKSVPGYREAVENIVLQFDKKYDISTTECRPSKNGNYLGLTVTVHVISREQLDELYRTLSTHPMVSVVL